MEYKTKFEVHKNILDAIPEGESILWKGKPSFWGFSWYFFGLKLLAFYLIILSVVFAARLTVTDFFTAFVVDFLPFLLSGILTSCILMALAKIQSQSSVYIITENRVIIKSGAALSFLISMPFKKIKAVNLQKRKGSLGTISFELNSGKRVPYISCWPSVRPWRFKKTEPAFSCIENVDEVATILRKSVMAGRVSLQAPTINSEFKSQIEQGV
mgnify:FL=1